MRHRADLAPSSTTNLCPFASFIPLPLHSHKNVIDSAQALLMAMRKLGVDPEEPNNRAHADRILEYRMDTEPLSVLPQEVLQSIESLWHDPVIPSVMDRSSEFYLMDSATYFFANIRKIGAADYVPDEADVLRARTKTTGISETRFNMGQLSIHMFDVGGQRSERKKWIHCELVLGRSVQESTRD
jgi:guanine nucleotide-binding protein subunit alpha